MLLTPERDIPIVTTLTRRVRLLSLDQIARTWWSENGDARRSASKRLRALEELELLGRTQIVCEPLLKLDDPLFHWDPGEPPPESFEAISNRLLSRWDAPPRSTTVFYATRTAVNAYGGCQAGFASHPYEATHDLHVAELYLRILRLFPDLAPYWRAEEELPRPDPGGFKPDAALVDPDGQLRLFIEFAGRYSPERLQKIHFYCVGRGFPYELW
jgi:hypothetical protein